MGKENNQVTTNAAYNIFVTLVRHDMIWKGTEYQWDALGRQQEQANAAKTRTVRDRILPQISPKEPLYVYFFFHVQRTNSFTS